MVALEAPLLLLETLINGCLPADPTSQQTLASLHGKIIAVEWKGPGKTLYVVPTPKQLFLQSHYEGSPDSTLHISPVALGQLLTDQNHPLDTIEISGDPEPARQLIELLRLVTIDWEGYLATYCGTFIAGEATTVIDMGKDWAKHIGQTLEEEFSHYVRQGVGDAPTQNEHADFQRELNELAQQTAQLEERLHSLRATYGPVGESS